MRVALAGNPNVGKSTLFNALTGMRQHTGNWPGKTVGVATGICRKRGVSMELTDLPGTYSLSGASEDERIAAEAVKRGGFDCVVAVCDGSCLERSLILVLQILGQVKRCVVCVNLVDEAEREGIAVDAAALEEALGVPVVLTAAGRKQGLKELVQQIGRCPAAPERVWEQPILEAQRLAACCTRVTGAPIRSGEGVDRILTGKAGLAVMAAVIAALVWLTVWGANYPSRLLEELMTRGYALLQDLGASWPEWLRGILVDGVYATCGRVISVMLPPMAIFFPLFTILEDVGYLPRMAFLMDHGMRCCGGCGKQALTLCMGLGCNAVGVTGCRIIDSPRERTAAILTNAMVPCNGRFPTLIVLGSLFFPKVGAAALVTLSLALGVAGAMGSSWALNRTVLRGKESTFLLELPPFRRPRIGEILVRSLLDRTGRMALRTMKVAAPAGALLWLLSRLGWLSAAAGWLDPIGRMLGMNGVFLLGFFFALPANELLLPVVLLACTGESLQAAAGMQAGALLQTGLNWRNALCIMLFTLFHWPCATTLMTVRRETGSLGKTAAAFLLPTLLGTVLCAVMNLLLGL